jgi:hypothetical protein
MVTLWVGLTDLSRCFGPEHVIEKRNTGRTYKLDAESRDERVNEDVAIRCLYNGGLVWERSASCGEAGLYLDCTWSCCSGRAGYGEPAIED